MNTRPTNPMWGEHQAKCSFPDCAGKLKFDEAGSAGLKVGDLIPFNSADPIYGRCPLCKRHKMQVVSTPAPPVLGKPKGFTRIPTE